MHSASAWKAALPTVLLLAACTHARPVPAGVTPTGTGFDGAAVGNRLPGLLDSGGVPGLATAVVQGDRVAWARGFGVRRAGSPEAVSDSTVFEAASLGKPVFAYLVLKLVDRGRLELDRPLGEYLPLPELRDPRAARITARGVLSHTTGLQNELHPGDSLALAFDPGSSFRYSGEGYAYLQRVVEHVTGESLEGLARELVFEPLGMARSGYTWEERFATDAAVGHGGGRIPRAPARPSAARAPSSLHTTASDYARFVAAIVEGTGLSDEMLREMGRAQARMSPAVAWGLGWALEEAESPPALWHWGDNSNTGFTAFVMISRSRGDGVIWLANSATGLSLAEPLLEMTLRGVPSRMESLGYERHDDARRHLREEIDRIAVERGAAAALAELERMRPGLPADRVGEGLLNALGYRMLERGRVADAVELFRANAALYPHSANVHDSLGEALAVTGEREAAVASYRRSLELDPGNRNAVEWLRRLGAAP